MALVEPEPIIETSVDISTPKKLDLVINRPGWMYRASCRGEDPLMFVGERVGAAARRMCAACPVREQCLEAALADVESAGLWGGTVERDRTVLRRQWRRQGNRPNGVRQRGWTTRAR